MVGKRKHRAIEDFPSDEEELKEPGSVIDIVQMIQQQDREFEQAFFKNRTKNIINNDIDISGTWFEDEDFKQAQKHKFMMSSGFFELEAEEDLDY